MNRLDYSLEQNTEIVKKTIEKERKRSIVNEYVDKQMPIKTTPAHVKELKIHR